MTKTKNIGIDVVLPKNTCLDKHCPFHGTIKVRGRLFRGKVVRNKATKTVQVEFDRIYPLRKYERFITKTTRITVHNPDCINANVGDQVQIMECRPISKTKSFVVIQK